LTRLDRKTLIINHRGTESLEFVEIR